MSGTHKVEEFYSGIIFDEKAKLPPDAEDTMFYILDNPEEFNLTDEECDVLIMTYIDGKRRPEIAEELGLSLARVNYIREHAMSKMRRLNISGIFKLGISEYKLANSELAAKKEKLAQRYAARQTELDAELAQLREENESLGKEPNEPENSADAERKNLRRAFVEERMKETYAAFRKTQKKIKYTEALIDYAISGANSAHVLSVKELPLSASIKSELINNDITTVNALARLSKDELLKIPGIGSVNIEKIINAVQEIIPSWKPALKP